MGKNARDWILTEYGISMADSQAHGQSQEKNVELHAKKAVTQGWSSRSAHRTAGTVCPDIVPQGIMIYKCDGRDRQNNSRTSFLRHCIPRKKEKKTSRRISISSLMESPSRVPLPPCHILFRATAGFIFLKPKIPLRILVVANQIVEEVPLSQGRCQEKRNRVITDRVVYTLHGCIIISKLGIIKGKGGREEWSSEPAQRKSMV